MIKTAEIIEMKLSYTHVRFYRRVEFLARELSSQINFLPYENR